MRRCVHYNPNTSDPHLKHGTVIPTLLLHKAGGPEHRKKTVHQAKLLELAMSVKNLLRSNKRSAMPVNAS